MSEDLEERVKDLEARVEDAVFLADRAEDRVDELEEELYEKDERIRDLEQTVESLQDADRLMQKVHRNAADKPTERAVLLIKKLNNEAVTNEQAGRNPTASMTIREALKQLNRDGVDVRRDTLYYTFKRADELVEGDVLRYKKEDRSSEKKSRLIADLEMGEMPSTVAGFEIRTPSYVERGAPQE
ncbi:hypothetical protein [Natrinema sp. DC36]|uniref:hypothetical protein n=1 Tax=Natrinema sp. DC36 TaxID=2878680 RepID=UPI001CF0A5A6|nr:hypothetical protein [Natrinema sp. DC36]